MRRKELKAFTLIEMAIVVLIIGLLAYALFGNVSFFNKDSQLPNKMNLLAKSFNKCIMDLDSAGYDIEQARNALKTLLKVTDVSEGNTLKGHVKVPKGKGYDLTNFYAAVGNDKGICRDFIGNLNNNVGAKWNTEVWYIPAGVPEPLDNYVDADYGGFLICATHSSKKYAEFQHATKKNKFYTCAILDLGMKSVGSKNEVLRAFGGDGKKVMKTNETTPNIPTE